MVSVSFMSQGEAANFPPPLLPAVPTLDHYRELFLVQGMGRYLVNSVILATLATVLALLFTVPALLLPFAIFTIVTEFTSFVAHTRRLANAQRATWLAVIVLIPMILGLAAYAAGTSMGAAQHRAMNAPPAEKVEGAKEGEAAKPAGERRQQPQRRGPPGPPQSERQAAIATGLGMAMPIWWLASSIVMAWTLVWVARLPNGGQGRVRTGSDLTPDEVEAGV
jgi:disulfide bond formation protein DsbB